SSHRSPAITSNTTATMTWWPSASNANTSRSRCWRAVRCWPGRRWKRITRRRTSTCSSRSRPASSIACARAFVWRNAELGENSFIFEGNVIQPFVRIGNNCILWSGNHVGHRTVVHDNVFVASHAVISGYCEIGENSFIGVNSTFNDHVKVAPDNVIGSGALVTRDTEPGRIYVGSPARAVPGKSSLDVRL